MSHNRVSYFKNLDGLRFLAALCVILGHCQAVLNNNYHRVHYNPYVAKLGTLGVDFFFVLSGFLISYLLMVEIETTQTVSIRNFYYRRFLRIWPLYFGFGILWIVLGTWQMQYFGKWIGYPPTVQSGGQLAENLLFLGSFSINFQTLLRWGNPFQVGHFWSLCVEEQFYLIWSPVFKRFKKQLLPAILVFIGIGFLNYLPHTRFFWGYENFQYNFTIGCFFQFGLGGLLAWLLHNGYLTPQYSLSKWASWALQAAFLIPTLMYLLGNYYVHEPFQAREHLVFGTLSVGIIGCAIAKDSILNLEFGWLKYLGKISFGIYVFHIAAVRFTEKMLISWFHIDLNVSKDLFPTPQYYLVLYPLLATFLAVGMATLSYEFFEKRFLKLKERFR
jgi:peptidoglycan/LPS O-acetylase OafA/YrhL